MTTRTAIANTTRAAKGGTVYSYVAAMFVDVGCGFENGLELPPAAHLDSAISSQWSIQSKRGEAPPGT